MIARLIHACIANRALVLMAASNLSFAWLASVGHSNALLAFTIGFENLASGIGEGIDRMAHKGRAAGDDGLGRQRRPAQHQQRRKTHPHGGGALRPHHREQPVLGPRRANAQGRDGAQDGEERKEPVEPGKC